jgi:hypothetical protein
MSDSVSNTYVPAHDPLCNQWYGWHGIPAQQDPDDCSICELIDTVTEQTIQGCIKAVDICTVDKGYVYSDTETGIKWAIAALRALLEEKP